MALIVPPYSEGGTYILREGSLVKALVALVILAAFVLPGEALAAKIAATLLPDGLYTVVVERVADGEHMTVRMETGLEVDLKAASHTVTFSPATANARVSIYIVEGEVVSVAATRARP